MNKRTRCLSIFYLFLFLINYVHCACTSVSSLQLVRPSVEDRALLEVNDSALSQIEIIEDELYVVGGNLLYAFLTTENNLI